jgi:transglutaminase-like putative cysteine protease
MAAMPSFTIRHTTSYEYRRKIAFGEHRMMLRPREGHDQRILDWKLEISPTPESVRWINDVFGNTVGTARFAHKADALEFRCSTTVEHSPQNSPAFEIDKEARRYPFRYDEGELPDLVPWLTQSETEQDQKIEKWARRLLLARRKVDTGQLLMALNNAVRESFKYERRSEAGTQTPAQTLSLGRGSCRDFAVFMIAAARSLGMAARFVSGYIYVPSRDGAEVRGGGSTHAWCQVYLPGAGWVDFDPTNGIVGNRELIRIAVAREPRQAVPISGTYDGLREDATSLDVEVLVTRDPEQGKSPDVVAVRSSAP